mmetsp:Transcript_34557/g.55612  ORF Transcript_34557/g.55612 Transcript_34557/m.55612 type:complete len:109 (-) Transcript_34557:372-698(-)
MRSATKGCSPRYDFNAKGIQLTMITASKSAIFIPTGAKRRNIIGSLRNIEYEERSPRCLNIAKYNVNPTSARAQASKALNGICGTSTARLLFPTPALCNIDTAAGATL